MEFAMNKAIIVILALASSLLSPHAAPRTSDGAPPTAYAAPEPAKTAGRRNPTPAEIEAEAVEFMIGEWRVSKFLGFDAITKDDVEWPDGEKIIGKTVRVGKDRFSTMDFRPDYPKFAAEIENPVYKMSPMSPLKGETDFSVWLAPDADESIRSLSDSDEVLLINVDDPKDGQGYAALYMINKNRLIISLNCDYFELERRP
jgi:hypothetical protein